MTHFEQTTIIDQGMATPAQGIRCKTCNCLFVAFHQPFALDLIKPLLALVKAHEKNCDARPI